MSDQASQQPGTSDKKPLAPQLKTAPPSGSAAGAGVRPVAASGTSQEASPLCGASPDDLDRIREIIMGGPEQIRQPLRKAETERLRDILFGSQMEEYERRFADLRREIDRVLNDWERAREAMDESREAQRERLDGFEREWRASHQALNHELDKVRTQGPVLQNLVPQMRQLQVLINGFGRELSDIRGSLTRENQELRALRSTVEQYRDQQERNLDTLKREKRLAEDELKDELRRVADRLGEEKTDRKVLAAILVELASRLETGYDPSGMLEVLTTPDEA